MEKNNLFQRFRYWLDKRMARGTGSMICALLFATAINAEIPSSSDGSLLFVFIN